MKYGKTRHRYIAGKGPYAASPASKRKLRRTAASVCMGIGLLIIVGVITELIWNYHAEKILLTSLSDQLGISEKAALISASVRLEDKPDEAAEDRKLPADKVHTEEKTVLGILSVPSIELSVPLAEGVDAKTLRTAAGHVPGTALPGDAAGNCAVAGHRNYSFGRFFNRLNEVKAGDLITVTGTEGVTYYYEVTDTFVVEPEDVSVLEASEEAELTLITCTPIYIASHRLIVRARLMSGESVTAP